MNAMLILTYGYVESLLPKPKVYFERDTSISGFAGKVLPSGKKTYNFEYSQDSKTKRLKLGDHLDEASFVTAKKMAGEYRVALAKHEDPSILHLSDELKNILDSAYEYVSQLRKILGG